MTALGVGRSRWALALVLLACLVVLPPPAAAQDREPSAEELRNEYPLHASPEATAERSPAPPPVSSPASPPADAQGGDTWLLVLVFLALAGGATYALLARGRRRAGHGGALLTSIAPALRHPRPVLSALGPTAVRATGPRAPQATAARLWKGRAEPEPERGPQEPIPSKPMPPATERPWTAEVEWRHSEGSSRFCVVAEAPGESRRVPIAESSDLEWPPTTPAAVQALTDAAERLEASLLDAGWTPLAQGEAWYAKRFAWQPAADRPAATPPAAPRPRQAAPPAAAAPAAPAQGTGRFLRAPGWTKATESQWRCEIAWDAGYVKSRFKAVVYAPGQRRGHAIGASAEFKWGLMADPDPNSPEYPAEVRRLANALEALGWQLVGSGAHWYSARFVWRGEGEPPDHVEPVQAHREST